MIPSKPPPTLEREFEFSIEFRDFIARCLTKNPSQRPSASDLLQDPFILKVQGHHVMKDIIMKALSEIQKGKLAHSVKYESVMNFNFFN